jgi:tetratricopeptide (TPR) repeat protein
MARLAWLLSGPEEICQQQAVDVLAIVLNEYLRAQLPSAAVAQAASWATGQSTAEHQATRAVVRLSSQSVLDSLTHTEAFPEELLELHPWRAAEAKKLAASWPLIRQMVHTITVSRDRGSLLRQWAQTPPTQLDSAPPEVWCWLGLLTADHADGASGNRFIETAIERGLPDASYWWARIAMNLSGTDDEVEAPSRDALARSQPPHALALAQIAVIEKRYQDGLDELSGWLPDKPNDRAIKAIARSACAIGLEDYNLAIAVLEEAIAIDPEASGPTLKAADLLLVRGYHLESDHRLTDFTQALLFAIKARDMRRRWRGDSVAATLIALKAAALSGDIDRAWLLTQPSPQGEATEGEANDRRLRKEAAILAATMMKTEVASTIAADLGDAFVTAMVDAYLAIDKGENDLACVRLLDAWDAASDDFARLQVAGSLAPLGGPLPDLTALAESQPQAVASLRSVHQVVSASGDRLANLRAHRYDSEQIAVLLAQELVDIGEVEEAADVLVEAGTRVGHPLLLKMAASRYFAAGNYSEAARTCRTAITVGGTGWPGELDCQMALFDALEAQGLEDESLPVARRLVSIAPDNRDTRWVLVLCLLRKGESASAWSALNYQGRPIPPRDRDDVRAWISLTSAYDRSPHFVGRAMDEMNRWRDDPEIAGTLLVGIYTGMMNLGIEPEPHVLEEVHLATHEYTTRFPDSPTFRSLPIGPDDAPLQAFEEELRRQHEHPGMLDLRDKVSSGQIPLGVLAEALHLPYAEAAIKRAAGFVYSFDPNTADVAAEAVSQTLGKAVVIDTTAAATLALLETATSDQLKGAFGSVQTTDLAFRDALATQQSLAPRPTMSLGWDAIAERPLVREISDEDADRMARQSEAIQQLLTATKRRAWQIAHYNKLDMRGAWINTLDLAVSTRTPYWSDDLLLRSLARQEGIPTFGTVDLLRALTRAGLMSKAEREAAEATLISNFHIQLGFDADIMDLAAQLDGWRAAGAAAAISKPEAWPDPEPVLKFVLRAIEQNHLAAPNEVRHWAAYAAVGLVRLAGDDLAGAGGNLRLVLERVMTQPWMRPDILPHLVLGIREGCSLRTDVDDPLEGVLNPLYREMTAKHGPRLAAFLLLAWVQHLQPEDQQLAARIILTADD